MLKEVENRTRKRGGMKKGKKRNLRGWRRVGGRGAAMPGQYLCKEKSSESKGSAAFGSASGFLDLTFSSYIGIHVADSEMKIQVGLGSHI